MDLSSCVGWPEILPRVYITGKVFTPPLWTAIKALSMYRPWLSAILNKTSFPSSFGWLSRILWEPSGHSLVSLASSHPFRVWWLSVAPVASFQKIVLLTSIIKVCAGLWRGDATPGGVQLDWRWIAEWAYAGIFAVTVWIQNQDQFWVSNKKNQGSYFFIVSKSRKTSSYGQKRRFWWF